MPFDPVGASLARGQVMRRIGRTRANRLSNGTALAHRGGSFLAPENTLIAVHSSFSRGLRVMNLDARSLGDGSLALVHDTTVDRTFTAVGPITDHTAASWVQLPRADPLFIGGGWAGGRGELLSEVMAVYDEKVVWVVEAFDAPGAIVLAKFALERNLEDNFIVTGRNLDWLPPVTALGVKAMFIHNLGQVAETPLGNTGPVQPQDLVSRGIQYVTFLGGEVGDGTNSTSGGANPADVKRYADAGLIIDIHTINRQVERQVYENKGFSVWTWSADDPVYVTGNPARPETLGYRRKNDPFKSQTWYPGMLPVNSGALSGRGVFFPPDRWGMQQSGFVLQGWGCPIQGCTPQGRVTLAAQLNPGTTYTTIQISPLAAAVPNGARFLVQTTGAGQVVTVATRVHQAGETALAISSLNPASTVPVGTVLQQEVVIAGNTAIEALPADLTRWFSIVFGSPTDRSYDDQGNTRDSRYKWLLRCNGQYEMSMLIAGVGGNAPGVPTTPTAAGIGNFHAPYVLAADLASGVAVTAVPVNALPVAISSGSRLLLPTLTSQVATVSAAVPVATPVSTSADLVSGAAITAIPVAATTVAYSAGSAFTLPTGQRVTLSAAAALGATSLAVASIVPSALVPSGSALAQAVSIIPVNSITPSALVPAGTKLFFVVAWTVTMRADKVQGTITANGVTKTFDYLDTTGPRGPYFYFGGSTNGNALQYSMFGVTITGN
jgi:hypothetical protein